MAKKSSLSNKFFFDAFKREIDEEHKEHETYQEKTKVDDNKCPHKNLRLDGHELRCSCGAFWTGTAHEVERVYKLLKSRN